jgi:hypothetical protein
MVVSIAAVGCCGLANQTARGRGGWMPLKVDVGSGGYGWQGALPRAWPSIPSRDRRTCPVLGGGWREIYGAVHIVSLLLTVLP